MTAQTRSQILDLYHQLRRASRATLNQVALEGSLALCGRTHWPFAACVALTQYARCRSWALYYRAQHCPHLARREAARAGQQTRYFHSL